MPIKRIVLVRHARPIVATNQWVNALGFAQWVRRYNKSGIDPTHLPPTYCFEHEEWFVVSSPLRRAIQSAQQCLGRAPDLQIGNLREMDIPRYRLRVRMPADWWVVTNRIAWMLGVQGRAEPYVVAKARATLAAVQLHDMSAHHNQIVVFGHGMMNLHVGKYLRSMGWQGSIRPLRYWDAIYLER